MPDQPPVRHVECPYCQFHFREAFLGQHQTEKHGPELLSLIAKLEAVAEAVGHQLDEYGTGLRPEVVSAVRALREGK